MMRRAIRLVPFLVLISIQAWSSTQSFDSALDLGWDKVAHVLVYAAIGLSAQFAVHRNLQVHAWRVSLGILLTTGFGMVDEWIQAGTPGRFPSVHDLIADAAGAGIGAFIWIVFARKLNRGA